MPEKINYYQKSLDEIATLGGDKPKLLLHACCGPCATFPVVFLARYFTVTILFNNSNIYPREEHNRRLAELRRLITELNAKEGWTIDVVALPYDNERYNEALEPFADEPEGGKRCHICYSKRMDQAFRYASEHDIPWFTTVMTISRQKDSQILNQIGAALQAKYPNTHYFYSDFKKKAGIDIAREMRLAYNLYQQLYCGCKYTFAKGEEKKAERLARDEYKG
jgi:epoxyqueuosine reductase